MARIFIDTWCVKSDASGMGRYGHGLVAALAAAAPHHEFIVLRTSRQGGRAPLTPLDRPAVREVFVHRPAADWATLAERPLLEPAFRRYGPPDLYHSLFHLVPIGLRVGRMAPRRTVVSLHDFIWLDRDARAEPRRLEAEWLKRFGALAIPHALRSADHVICGSDATSRRAAQWVPVERRTTVYYGLGNDWFAAGASGSDAQRASPPYIAAFGVAKAYKNVRCLVRALPLVRRERGDVRLMLLGGDGGTADEVRAAGLADHVVVRERLSDDELREAIRGARVFVVPSLAEGFGLPALEAMAVGTPLVVSDIEPLREVTDGAALLFSPSDPHDLAAAILRLLTDAGLGASLAARGRARAAQFTWSRAADQTLAVYEQVLSKKLSKKGTGVVL